MLSGIFIYSSPKLTKFFDHVKHDGFEFVVACVDGGVQDSCIQVGRILSHVVSRGSSFREDWILPHVLSRRVEWRGQILSVLLVLSIWRVLSDYLIWQVLLILQ